MTDRDAARLLIQKFGPDKAHSRATRQASNARARGDQAGCTTWTRVRDAIDDLRFGSDRAGTNETAVG